MKRRDVLLVLGKTGSGKSHLVKDIVSRLGKVIVFDPREEYHLGVVFTDANELIDFVLDHWNAHAFVYVCRFGPIGEYRRAAELAFILGDCTVVMEEAELFLSSYDRDSTDPLNIIISQGRHKSVSVIAISRRPTEIPVRLRSDVDQTITFEMREPGCVDYLLEWGFDLEELEALTKERHNYAIVGSSSIGPRPFGDS